MHAMTAPSAAFPASDRLPFGGLGATPSLQSAPDASVDSHQLLQGRKAVAIHHNGAVYRLQSTKLGKLILTK